MRVPKKVISNARRLRRNLSPPEVRLWSHLRSRAPGKPVFRRQHPIGPYVLDFYCAKAHLAVEIDGISHDLGNQPRHDVQRDLWLKKNGVTVIRLSVSQLMSSVDEAADAIMRLASEKP
jgi:very-short-patch-repair endonuclease